MQNNPKNSDLQNRLLQSLTKYASKPMGFDKMFLEEENLKKREVEYASSLPLQIILYFNVFFSFVWAIGTIFLLPPLGYKSTDENRVLIILIFFFFFLMVIFEFIRLYIGFIGNLSERVPELMGFFLLTCLIELPLSIFLVVIVWIPIGKTNFIIVQEIPMQFSLQIFHAIFVFAEVIFGFIAVRVLARYQISRFHYKQFDHKEYNTKENDQDLDWINDLDKNNHFKMKPFDMELKVTYN